MSDDNGTCFDSVWYFCAHVELVLLLEFSRAGYCSAGPYYSWSGRSVFEAWQEVIVMPFYTDAQAWWALAACLVCFVAGLWFGWWYSR